MQCNQSSSPGPTLDRSVTGVSFREAKPISLKAPHERAKTIAFTADERNQSRFHVRLYRFMAESIPIVNSVIWTWSRLAAAPGLFKYTKDEKETESQQANIILESLFRRINRVNFGRDGAVADILPAFFRSLFLDGAKDQARLGKVWD